MSYLVLFLKNVHYKLTNYTVHDDFIPSPTEMKFRLTADVYGKVKARKSWTYIYEVKGYGRYKK